MDSNQNLRLQRPASYQLDDTARGWLAVDSHHSLRLFRPTLELSQLSSRKLDRRLFIVATAGTEARRHRGNDERRRMSYQEFAFHSSLRRSGVRPFFSLSLSVPLCLCGKSSYSKYTSSRKSQERESNPRNRVMNPNVKTASILRAENRCVREIWGGA